MADWKYIMFEANGQLTPVIFPGELIHADVAKAMGYIVRQQVIRAKPNNWSSKLVSAGFISGLAVTCVHGKSESLDDLPSVDTDASIINLMPYEAGRESQMANIEPMLLIKIIEHLMARIKETTVD